MTTKILSLKNIIKVSVENKNSFCRKWANFVWDIPSCKPKYTWGLVIGQLDVFLTFFVLKS